MKGRATRGEGMHLVPSQITERIQAVDPPAFKPVSTLERMLAWYDNSSWAGWALLAVGFVFFVWSMSMVIYDWGK